MHYTKKYGNSLLSLFMILNLVISFTSCNDDGDGNYPSLKVVNQTNDHHPIASVELVGYKFANLIIDTDESQTFSLTEGMSGGYNEINVTVRYGPPGSVWSSSKKVNFSNGSTTTVKLTGCISYSECSGFNLE